MIDAKKIDYSKLAPFRFKKLKSNYLITNEVGDYAILNPDEFKNYLYGALEKNSPKYKELSLKNFLKSGINFGQYYIEKYKQKYHYLFQGPSLHIIVLTLRCNHRCIYCQASPKLLDQQRFDLDEVTAKKIVDFIFSVNSQNITIEFQGGEPLVNWPVLEYIVKYSRILNKIKKKKLLLSLVSNLSFLDNGKIKFLIDQGVSFCTSLDGPAKLHNFHRRLIRGNSYEKVIQGLIKLQNAYKKMPTWKVNEINALPTITRYSLKYPKEIVKEYIKLGFKSIFLRPVSSFGLAKRIVNKIGFSAQEYIIFYRQALDYIINLNLQGKFFSERTAQIFLTKILTKSDPNYLELRSPCGAGLGQLAYNYNGDIYTCDEGRMLAEMGDFSFKLGNVSETKYFNLINHPTIKTLALASCLDNLPQCCHCVWKPYCGTCPLYNYNQGNNIFSQMPNNRNCQINQLILEYLFERLSNQKIKSIFMSWIKKNGK